MGSYASRGGGSLRGRRRSTSPWQIGGLRRQLRSGKSALKSMACTTLTGAAFHFLPIAAQVPSNEIGSRYFQETHPEYLFRQCSHYCELVSQPEQMPRVLTIAASPWRKTGWDVRTTCSVRLRPSTGLGAISERTRAWSVLTTRMLLLEQLRHDNGTAKREYGYWRKAGLSLWLSENGCSWKLQREDR